MGIGLCVVYDIAYPLYGVFKLIHAVCFSDSADYLLQCELFLE